MRNGCFSKPKCQEIVSKIEAVSETRFGTYFLTKMGARGVPQGAPELQIGGPREGKKEERKRTKNESEKQAEKRLTRLPGTTFFGQSLQNAEIQGRTLGGGKKHDSNRVDFCDADPARRHLP